MHNEDDAIVTFTVDAPAGPLDEAQSELPQPKLSEQVVDVPGDPNPPLTTAELVAIYSLLKAGFTAEDFS